MNKNKQFPKMEMSDLVVTLNELLGDFKFLREVNGQQSVVKSGLKTIKEPKMFAGKWASEKV